MRKAQFSRPEPGFSLYEGRTRGKRARYTFSEDDEEYSDAISTRRSARHSGIITPSDQPTITASGRQVRSRMGGAYGETLTAGQGSTSRQSPATGDYLGSEESDGMDGENGDGKRKARPGWKGWAMVVDDGPRQHIAGYNAVDAMDEDEDEASSSGESGDEWDDGNSDDDDVIRARDADDEDDNSSDDSDSYREPRSLIVRLRYGKKALKPEPDMKTNGFAPVQASPPSQPGLPKPVATAAVKAEAIQPQPQPTVTHHSPMPSHFHTPYASQSGQIGSTSTPTASVKTEPVSSAASYTTSTSLGSIGATNDAAFKANQMAWAPTAQPFAQATTLKANQPMSTPSATQSGQSLPPISAITQPPPYTVNVAAAAAPLQSPATNRATAPPPAANGTATPSIAPFRQGTLDGLFASKPAPQPASMPGHNGP